MARKKPTSLGDQKKRKRSSTPKILAPRSVGPECDPTMEAGGNCTSPYCEFYCSNNTWYLAGEDHPPSMTCPESLEIGNCTTGSTFCSSPISHAHSIPEIEGVGSYVPRDIPLNSGDYVLVNNQLMLVRGRYTPGGEYYCPNMLTLTELCRHEPTLAPYVALAAVDPRFVELKVNIRAFQRPIPESTETSTETSTEKSAKKKSARKGRRR